MLLQRSPRQTPIGTLVATALLVGPFAPRQARAADDGEGPEGLSFTEEENCS